MNKKLLDDEKLNKMIYEIMKKTKKTAYSFFMEVEEVKFFKEAIDNIEMPNNRDKEFTITEFEKSNIEENKGKALYILGLTDKTINDIVFEESNTKSEYLIFLKRNGLSVNIRLESEGIKKTVLLLVNLIKVQDGGVLIIDELDSHISTVTLLKLFYNIINVNSNKKGQLIISSHNPILMSEKLLKGEQISIVEKNDSLESEVYSLGEFKEINEIKDRYNHYLKGKLGGINIG